jgi:hypothetical protein
MYHRIIGHRGIHLALALIKYFGISRVKAMCIDSSDTATSHTDCNSTKEVIVMYHTFQNKMYLIETEWGGTDWSDLVQDRD